MRMLQKLLVAGILALPMPSYASPPMSRDSIQIITAALPECTGGWIETGKRDRVSAMDLAPRLSLLSGPSSALDQDAGEDLYQIAKGLLAPATGVHERMLDGDPYLNALRTPRRVSPCWNILSMKSQTHGEATQTHSNGLGLLMRQAPLALKMP